MKHGRVYREFNKEFEEDNGISIDDLFGVIKSVSQVFPMIVVANLSKNTYTMIKDDGFLAGSLPKTGKYDDMIDFGVANIHPNYQNVFLDSFSRERLLGNFDRGRKEIAAKLYQKGRGDQYQWVTTHVIRLPDRDGDVCHICINKVIEDEGMPRVSGGAPY
jgi:hypothetical protein